MLRIKVLTDHVHKRTLTIDIGYYLTLGSTKCLQTLTNQINAKLNSLNVYECLWNKFVNVRELKPR